MGSQAPKARRRHHGAGGGRLDAPATIEPLEPRLLLDGTQPFDDAYEDNDELAQAYDLAADQGWALSDLMGLAVQADHDWYAVLARPDAERLLVDCRFAHAAGDIDVELYDALGYFLARSDSVSDDELIAYDLPYPNDGLYYVRVYGDNAANEYNLWWTDEPWVDFADDDYEQNDAMGEALDLSAAEGWWLSELLGPAVQGDHDWYAIDVPDGAERVVVDCLPLGAGGDVFVDLYDAWGRLLLASETMLNQSEVINYTVPAGGLYLVDVWGSDFGNAYDLRWAARDPSWGANDPYEPNDERALAWNLSAHEGRWLSELLGRGVQLDLDEDWYQLHVDPLAAWLDVSCRGMPTEGHLDLDLYDWNGTWLADGYGLADSPHVHHQVAYAGTYYVRVTGEGVASSYDLLWETATWEEGFDDAMESNDTPAEAFDLWGLEGQYLADVADLGIQADDDWYEITVDAGHERILVDCLFQHAEGNVDLALYDDAGYLQAVSLSQTDDEFIDWIGPQDGTYYVWVGGDNAGNVYDLWWDDLMPGAEFDDAYEDNDAFGLACDLSDHANVWLSSLSGPGVLLDEDWYEVALDAEAEMLFVTFRVPDGTGPLDVQLFDAWGNWVPSFSGATDYVTYVHSDPFQTVPAGTYYVSLNPTDDGGDVYDLSWHVVPLGQALDDIYEPSNFPQGAFDLSLYERTWLSAVGEPGFAPMEGIQADSDWYTIGVDEHHERVIVECRFADGAGDIDIALCDADGVLLAESATAGDLEYIDYEVPAAGTYCIWVGGQNAGNAYDLWWDDVAPDRFPDDPYEQNDALPGAFDLAGSEGLWLADLDGQAVLSDPDWYEVRLDAGSERLLALCQLDAPAAGFLMLSLYDEAGTRLAEEMSATSDFVLLDYTAYHPGVYYLLASSTDVGLDYDLWWDDLAPGQADLVILPPASTEITAAPGEVVSVDVEVANVGDGVALAMAGSPDEPWATWFVSLRLSDDPQMDWLDDEEVAAFALELLDAGESSRETLTFTAPAQTGTYYLAGLADADGLVPQPMGNDWGEVITLHVGGGDDPFLGKADAPDFYQYQPEYPPALWPGLAYCVPTAAADAIVWFNEHGFETLPDRADETDIVLDLADAMDTDDWSGTPWANVVPGLIDYLGDHRPAGSFQVTGLGFLDGGECPGQGDFDDIGELLIREDTAIVVTGSAFLDGQDIGGHAVFLAGFDVAPGNPVLFVHDPDTGPGESLDTLELAWMPEGYYEIRKDGAPYDVPGLPEDNVRWTGAAVITLSSEQAEPQADLVLTDPGTTEITTLPGEPISLDIEVRNVGEADAFAADDPQQSWDVAVLLSADWVFTADETVGGYALNHLAVGASHAESVAFEAPTQPGVYYLYPFADVSGLVDESDEGNNGWLPITLTVLPATTHVLSVGVRDEPSLLAGDAAAQLVHDAFGQLGSAHRDLLLLDTAQPNNKADLLAAIDAMAQALRPGDTFVLYFASHGGYQLTGDEEPVDVQVDPGDLDARQTSTGDEYLHLSRVAGGDNALADDDFRALFADAAWEQVNKLFVLDTCFAGGHLGSTALGDTGDLSGLSRVGLIAAAEEGNFAWAAYDAPSGHYVPVLGTALAEAVEALKDQPAITFEELFEATDARGAVFNGAAGRVLDVEDTWTVDGQVVFALQQARTGDFGGYVGATELDDLDPKTKVQFTDADGDVVTVSLRGEGTGFVARPTTADDRADADEIHLEGTVAKSSLTISVKKGPEGDGRTTVGTITIAGSLKSLTGKTTSLAGNLVVDGALGKLILDDVAASHMIEINAAGLADLAKDTVTLTFDRVADTILNTHNVPIKSLTVTEWLQADAGGGDEVIDSILAPWIGKLTTKGAKANARKGIEASRGDFAAMLILDGADRKGRTIGSAKIAGELSGFWDLSATDAFGNLTAGDVGTIKALGATTWTLAAPGGGVKGLLLTGDATGALTAQWLGKLTTKRRKEYASRNITAADGDFLMELTLLGGADVSARQKSLGSARIAGTAAGEWSLTGPSGSLRIDGDVSGWGLTVLDDAANPDRAGSLKSLTLGNVDDADVTVADALGSVKALRWAAGRVEAETIKSLSIKGKRRPEIAGDFGADLIVHGAAGSTKAALGSVKIVGDVSSANWDVTGGAGKVSLGRLLADIDLSDLGSIKCASPLVRVLGDGEAAWLAAVEGADSIWHVTFDSIRRWPKTVCDYETAAADPDDGFDDWDLLSAMTLESLKDHAASSGLGKWTGDPGRLKPGLIASFAKTKDPRYRFVKNNAYVYDNALAIEAFLMDGQPDAESLARAFQVADALVLLQDHDPDNAAAGPDGQFADLTPAPIRDVYQRGVVAKELGAAKVTVRLVGPETFSSGNQAYVAMALLHASQAAELAGEAFRAAEYLRTAKELLLYVGRNREDDGALGGFRMRDAAASARACEHNIDLAWAFERMAAAEADAALKGLWQGWQASADGFRNAMYGANERFATLDWVADDWQYFRAGAGADDQIDKDLVPIDTGAWSALARGDFRSAAFNLLAYMAASTDAAGIAYQGFDPGFRAVIDDALASTRDGVGSEVTAYMVLIARAMGDAAIVAALPDAGTLSTPEQLNHAAITAAAAGPADDDLARTLVGQLADIQLHASGADGLGLPAAPARGVGTGEYDLVNGWSLASTCWARFAYEGWNVYSLAAVD